MNKIDRHMNICKDLNKIYEQKNHDYGDSFHETFVEEGMAMARIRLSDKLNRFKKLSRAGSEQKVNDENIRDTLLDLANYAIMTVMEMDILAEEEHRKNLMSLGEKISKMKGECEATYIQSTCPICGGFMLFEKELDRYVCEDCGVTYGVKASNGKPSTDPDPCIMCGKPAIDKAVCCKCPERLDWQRRQRSDTESTSNTTI